MSEPPPLLRALGQVVRERRLQLELTQEQLGDLHRNTVGAVERGALSPSVTQLARIAKALGARGSELLAEAEQRASGRRGGRRRG